MILNIDVSCLIIILTQILNKLLIKIKYLLLKKKIDYFKNLILFVYNYKKNNYVNKIYFYIT